MNKAVVIPFDPRDTEELIFDRKLEIMKVWNEDIFYFEEELSRKDKKTLNQMKDLLYLNALDMNVDTDEYAYELRKWLNDKKEDYAYRQANEEFRND